MFFFVYNVESRQAFEQLAMCTKLLTSKHMI
jgi:hypothetical protein